MFLLVRVKEGKSTTVCCSVMVSITFEFWRCSWWPNSELNCLLLFLLVDAMDHFVNTNTCVKDLKSQKLWRPSATAGSPSSVQASLSFVRLLLPAAPVAAAGPCPLGHLPAVEAGEIPSFSKVSPFFHCSSLNHR